MLERNSYKVKVNIIILGLLTSITVVLAFNLIKYQLIEGYIYLERGRRVSGVNQYIDESSRGLVYGASGGILAENLPSYALYIEASLLPVEQQRELFGRISDIFGLDGEEQVLENYRSLIAKTNAVEVKVVDQMNLDDYIKILTLMEEYDSILVKASSVRYYPQGESVANLLGYTSIANIEDVKNGAIINSDIGRDGLEQYYEDILKGDSKLQKSGNSLRTSIKLNWQETLFQVTKEVLEGPSSSLSAAGVVLNSNTGEVVSMVSYPSYDNNLFSLGISSKDYLGLLEDEGKPLINKAIAAQLSPGSTFKTISASILLDQGVVDQDTQFLSNRCMQLSGSISFCEADRNYIGEVDVKRALTKSSNIFFCKAMASLRSQGGSFDTLQEQVADFGFGEYTGVDLNGEVKGTLPSSSLKQKLVGLDWFLGDDCNSVIGQGFLTVTPLQLAVAVSAISNGGEILEPYIVESIIDENGDVVSMRDKYVVKELDIEEESFEVVRKGMEMAAKRGGTAGLLDGLPGNLIAKTGSADASELVDGELVTGAHSWVVTCFDYQLENYCMVVMQEWGGRGSKTVPIVKNFLDCIYHKVGTNCQIE